MPMHTLKITSLIAAATIGLPAMSATIFTGGVGGTGTNLLDVANWDNGLPGAGNDGVVNMNAGYTGLSNGSNFPNGGTVTFGGGATISLALDLAISGAGSKVIVNNATVNATDDMFVQVGTLELNAGSTTHANDDYEANAGTGTLIINGGTHTAGDSFGTQNGTDLVIDFNGGSMAASRMRFQNGNTSVSGDATLSTGSLYSLGGSVNLETAWTGSWTVTGFTGSSWQDTLTNPANGFKFDGDAIDATVFANNFEVINGGQTLQLVPEPGSLALLALGGLMMVRRRRG